LSEFYTQIATVLSFNYSDKIMLLNRVESVNIT